jgi:predicted nucleic acid-binding protein
MRILLDTNILIHREAATVVRPEVGPLFAWLDRLGAEKCIHPTSISEIGTHADPRVRASFQTKLSSYHALRTIAPMNRALRELSAEVDRSANDLNDTAILNELVCERVDYLISEDRAIARKAEALGFAQRVFTIDAFLEKSTAENPSFTEYSVLAIRRSLFGDVPLATPFFESFRTDYPGFDIWFNRKADEPAYVCYEGSDLVAFLYLKLEGQGEAYPDITPQFCRAKRLKIGTLKVLLNGFKLGERFLKIVFDNALRQEVDEIYVTIFPRSVEQQRLIKLLEDFGFVRFGVKTGPGGQEDVYVRSMQPSIDSDDPRRTFPFLSRAARWFIVPIYPEYHTSLLPDSILSTESPTEFVESLPHRNAISKVYVSRSYRRDMKKGDVIVFYRTGGYYKSVVTTLGIIESTHLRIPNEETFIQLCRHRSVFSDDELRAQWQYRNDAPFTVDFLYTYSFPKRPNLAALIEAKVIRSFDAAPRGFELLSDASVAAILRLTGTNPRIVVNSA